QRRLARAGIAEEAEQRLAPVLQPARDGLQRLILLGCKFHVRTWQDSAPRGKGDVTVSHRGGRNRPAGDFPCSPAPRRAMGGPVFRSAPCPASPLSRRTPPRRRESASCPPSCNGR